MLKGATKANIAVLECFRTHEGIHESGWHLESVQVPFHLESMSASFFSPEMWLHSKLVPVTQLH